jgi:Polyketide cyclase / dehydrase and lipid transport
MKLTASAIFATTSIVAFAALILGRQTSEVQGFRQDTYKWDKEAFSAASSRLAPPTQQKEEQQHNIERHPHDGVAVPWPSGKPGVVLDSKAEETLARGKPVQTMAHFQVDNDNQQQRQPPKTISRRMIVQDVEASVETVMERILDYNQYAKMVPGILQSEIYDRETLHADAECGDDSDDDDVQEQKCAPQRFRVRMKAGVPFMQFEFYSDIRYDPKRQSISWTLDYEKYSQVHESVGMWYIQPLYDDVHQQGQGRPRWSRVYYAAEHTLFQWAPKLVQDLINKSSLTDGVSDDSFKSLSSSRRPRFG